MPRSYYTGPDILAPLEKGYFKRHVVTFDGWNGKWWKRLKVGKSAWSAFLWNIPFKYSIALELGQEVAGALRTRSRRTLAR
jgi:hypothetical protein